MKIYIAKADQELEIDVESLPANTLDYIVRYGLTQSLSDAAASIKGDSANVVAETMALVNKRLDKLLANNPPALGTRIGGGDPVKTKAIELALAHVVRPRWKAAKKAVDAKAMRAEAVEIVKKNGAYIELAHKALEREAAEIAELAAMEAAAIESAVEELTENAPLADDTVL